MGQGLSSNVDNPLTLEGLEMEMGIGTRDSLAGCIRHSDRGVQYANDDHVARLERLVFGSACGARAIPMTMPI